MNEHNRRRGDNDPIEPLYGMLWVVGILIATVLLASVFLGGD